MHLMLFPNSVLRSAGFLLILIYPFGQLRLPKSTYRFTSLCLLSLDSLFPLYFYLSHVLSMIAYLQLFASLFVTPNRTWAPWGQMTIFYLSLYQQCSKYVWSLVKVCTCWINDVHGKEINSTREGLNKMQGRIEREDTKVGGMMS